VWAVVVAAGRGARMGSATPKQFLPLAGRPLLCHTLDALLAHPAVAGAVVAIPHGWRERVVGEVVAHLTAKKPVRLVSGGRTRAESVSRGLARTPAAAEVVLVHDGARPRIALALIDRLLAAVARHGAAIPALPATDTLKERTAGGLVKRTLDRDRIVCVQTPQAFRRELLARAYARGGAIARATDCASVVERLGAKVAIVPGERENLKVTDPLDLVIATRLLAPASSPMAGSW
jgi:2-C-methyl-D-erythritol 4-phosphate cytidylyltransferase